MSKIVSACDLIQLVARYIYAADDAGQYSEVKFGCDCGCYSEGGYERFMAACDMYDNAAEEIAEFCFEHGLTFALGPCLATGCAFDWDSIMRTYETCSHCRGQGRIEIDGDGTEQYCGECGGAGRCVS